MSNYYLEDNSLVIEPDQSNLKANLTKYLRNWPWFILSVMLALVVAYIYLLYQQPVYRAKASMLVKDEQKGATSSELMKEFDIFGQQKLVDNEIEILKSYMLMDKVVGDLRLDVRYFLDSNFGKREIYGNEPVQVIVEQAYPELYHKVLTLNFPDADHVRIDEVNYPVNKSVWTPYGRLRINSAAPLTTGTAPLLVQVVHRDEMVEAYLGSLSVETKSKQSTVIELTLDDAVPAKAKAILNSMMEHYNAAAIEDKNKTAANTLRFLDERLQLVSGELQTVEKDVEVYKTRNSITDLSTEAENFLQRVGSNDAQLNQVNIQLGTVKDIERYINSRSQDREVAPSTLGLSDPVLLALISQVSDMEFKRESLLQTSSPLNPNLQILESQIRNTKANIRDNVQTAKTMLETSQQQLLVANRKMERVIRSIPKKERLLLDISRQQAIKNNLYSFLLQKREETAVSYASTIADSRIVDTARSGKFPIKPVGRTIYLLFAVVGLLIPMGVITAKDSLNNRVTRRLDIETITQAPILGEVMKSKEADKLVMGDRSVIAEQIRTIRTNLQFVKPNTESQVLLFTSSIGGEGKTFLSLNLGASLALVDCPTVILEMDLRKPQLRKTLGMSSKVGISNYLIGDATLDEALHPIPGYDNYYIMPSGPVPPNPSELLSRKRLEQLFSELRQRFTHVLVDSPPIGLVSDAQLIAPFADSTLYMVRHDVTPKNYLKMVDTLYKEQRFHNLNIILNGVGQSKNDSYYYNYSYGYYGEDPEKA
ncbi:capsular biosynthesis protein [Siphonobacter sp. BAB-5405]|uniref:GumC family protein n=1 Tax=Siphonobacter sp. BAB-5405 TaxID=1864825 RepID=UPI000C808D0D|nr:tyrosine-protein kinase [Siphonobacter sp. BAB-5405]PMD90712.1 capsular biosynthesis protein [Siphonobacter sp. BAB-5405]